MRRYFRITSNLTILAAALAINPQSAIAQVTTLPSPLNPALTFQTTGRERPPEVGDWYTTLNSASTDRIHRFFISVTPSDLAAAGGAIPVRILDGESNGTIDEINASLFGTVVCVAAGDNCDPSRFTLLAPGGGTLGTLTYNIGLPSADGQNDLLGTITAPGIYQVTSEAGALPISGDPTFALNNDDNGFRIQVLGVADLLVGQFQGNIQQNSGASINLRLFTLVGPGTGTLSFRNFDLDNGAALSYISPPGGLGTLPATISLNGVWNGGGNLDTGADNIAGLNPLNDAGAWEFRVNALTTDNQTLFEANTGPARLPLFDTPPTRAGNFTITTDTTRETPVGQRVCHPFRVTNNFFTTDIVNLVPSGTNPNYTAQFFRDEAGTLPLTDTDGDGQVDTGILAANGGFVDLFLCVTPAPGAIQPDGTILTDTTTITATSFMDRKVRTQAGAGAPVPQSVVKTTRPSPAGAGTSDFKLVKRITNVIRNGAPLAGVNFGAVIDDLTDPNDTAAGFAQIPLVGATAIPITTPVQSNDEVTYTVYFLSDGASPAVDAKICDLIPGGMSFIPESLELKIGSAAAFFASPSTKPGGNFYASLAPLPNNNSCTIQTNPNGAAIYELGTVSNSAGSNFGFARFRVRVN
ncbi:DUF11 domain-containing protein [Phormidium sp. CLA17]|nr:DUF11 domain-containing protein [Leptolyngbya sp. Cla-17]